MIFVTLWESSTLAVALYVTVKHDRKKYPKTTPCSPPWQLEYTNVGYKISTVGLWLCFTKEHSKTVIPIANCIN
jgi:hypothetical protein